MQLTWKASKSACAMHAVHAVAQGWTLTAPDSEAAFAPLAQVPPSAARGDLARLTGMLLAEAAAGIEQHHALAESVMVKLWGRGAASDSEMTNLATWIGSAERALFDWRRGKGTNELEDEIFTRTGPLRDLWQARGLGMLRAMGRLTDPQVLVEHVNVVMVLPVLGGHAMAHLPVKLVTCEAVLTNVDELLPEVVRLAWVLAQLQIDLPERADHAAGDRLARLAQAAMLPPVLAAAEVVELAEFSEASIARAALVWRVASTHDEANQLAITLWQWWRRYQRDRTRWSVAVAALEQTLAT